MREKLPLLALALTLLGVFVPTLKAVFLIAANITFGLRRKGSAVDLAAVVLLLFLSAYYFSSIGGDGDKTEIGAGFVLLPVLLYVTGKWFGEKIKSGKDFLWSFMVIAAALSSQVVASVLLNLYQNGFAGQAREVEIIGLGDVAISATVMGGTLTLVHGLAGVLFCSSRFFPFESKFSYLWMLLISLLVSLRIGSRTQLVIFGFSVLIGFYLNRRDLDGRTKALVAVCAVLAVVAPAFFFDQDLAIMTYFQDRFDDEGASVGSAGGRSERWERSIELLFASPFGWAFNEVGYAHNLWLDVARVGGWLSFVLSVGFSVLATLISIRLIRRNSRSRLVFTVVICSNLAFNLLFFVEPILDGFLFPFGAYCAVIGVFSGMLVRKKMVVD